jgi:hypothetical protein
MYDKSILAKSTGASIGVVAIVGMLFLSTGTAFAAPISGIGGFVIQADRIEGDNLVLYPGAGDAENTANLSGVAGGAKDAYPQAVVELTQVDIDGLTLIKNFDLSKYGLNGRAQLVITAGNGADAEALLLKTPQLSADNAVFSGLEIDETAQSGTNNAQQGQQQLSESIQLTAPSNLGNNPQGLPEKNIQLGNNANPGLVLSNANIRATYLATNQITLPDLALEVRFDYDDDGTYEYQ